MYSRIARIMPTSFGPKKMVFTAAGFSMAYAYAQECKNDVIFFYKSK